MLQKILGNAAGYDSAQNALGDGLRGGDVGGACRCEIECLSGGGGEFLNEVCVISKKDQREVSWCWEILTVLVFVTVAVVKVMLSWIAGDGLAMKHEQALLTR